MKIIHTSDIHLDSPLSSRLPSDKVRERRRELISGFGRLVGEAKSLGVDAILISGDLFDSTRVSKKAMDTALDVIEENPKISFFYLQGNHEGDALNAHGIALPTNLKTFGDDWTYYDLGDVIIAGRNCIKEGMFKSLDLPSHKKNIVLLHGEVREKTAYPDIIGINEAKERNIDYIALGHYHSHQSFGIDDRGVAVYSGTPEGRGFDEVGTKGYVLIDTDGRVVSYSFRPFAKRTLHIIKLDITGVGRASEISERAKKELQLISYWDIVRLEIVGRYNPSLFKDLDSLSTEYKDRFYYFEIKDSSRIAIDPEDYKYDKSLKGEFIRTVSADSTLDEETKEKIIACGINALMGEELFD